MLSALAGALRCPVCGHPLQPTGTGLACAAGHTFDRARHGHVNLASGLGRAPVNADSAETVAARVDFLAAGHFDALARLVAERVAQYLPPHEQWIPPHEQGLPAAATPAAPPLVLDAGSGPGHYLRAVLDRVPAALGLAVDSSTPAARRAARAHPHAGAVAWDLRQPLPMGTATVAAVLNVFAPRNAAEFARVLRADGVLVVVTPSPRHLRELVAALGLITVDEAKPDRLAAALAGRFAELSTDRLDLSLNLTRSEVESLVRMGPNAHHVDAGALRRLLLAQGPDPTPVTASFVVSVHRRR